MGHAASQQQLSLLSVIFALDWELYDLLFYIKASAFIT